MLSRAVGLLRRAVAAVLVVALPAMSGTMLLPGAESGATAQASEAHSHAGRHDGCGGPRHQSTHHQCCDLCGIGCGCSVQVGAPGFRRPSAVVTIHSLEALRHRTVRLTRARHLFPLPLGPPTPLV